MDIWLSLLTIIASGVGASVVTFRLTARRDDLRFRREKLEALYRAYTGYSNQLGRHWTTLMGVMAGTIEYNEALDIINSRGADEPRHFDDLSMLVAVYFPEFQHSLDTLINLRERAGDVISQHKRRYKQVGPGPDPCFREMQSFVGELAELEVSFGKEVRTTGHALRRRLTAA